MYNVIIWGAGESGNYTYRALEHHRNYRVIAFGDNDSNLQGKKKYNLPIVSAEQKDYIELCDLIVIASVHFLEIYNQLSQVTTIPIYKSIDEIMYTKVSVDISGYCNAKCRWCVTGGGI